MNKIYQVSPASYSYAEYYRMIVVAPDEVEAMVLVVKSDMFEDHQFPLIVEEIDLTKSDIIGMEGLDV